MPSTSVKQHSFMQAVAHSPSFAKKAGVSQSVGKDFSAADKSKTFNKGGMMKKNKRFNGEDGESAVEYHDYDPDETYSGRFFDDDTGALAKNTPTRAAKEATPARAAKEATPARAAPTPARGGSLDRENDGTKYSPPKSSFGETKGRQAWSPSNPDTPRQAYDSDEVGAVTGRRGDPKYKRVVTDEQKAKNAENFGQLTAALLPVGGAIAGAGLAYKGLSAVEKLRKLDKAKVSMREILAARRAAGYAGHKKGGAIMDSKAKGMKASGMPPPGGARPDPRMMARRPPRMGAGMPPSAPPVMPPLPPMPPQQPMGMKKGGMPMKDGKPAFMQKKMMHGGMTHKYAHGGGIESRGKTKGTIIRMAAGGSVSSRADGIAQRGKTKFTNY